MLGPTTSEKQGGNTSRGELANRTQNILSSSTASGRPRGVEKKKKNNGVDVSQGEENGGEPVQIRLFLMENERGNMGICRGGPRLPKTKGGGGNTERGGY